MSYAQRNIEQGLGKLTIVWKNTPYLKGKTESFATNNPEKVLNGRNKQNMQCALYNGTLIMGAWPIKVASKQETEVVDLRPKAEPVKPWRQRLWDKIKNYLMPKQRGIRVHRPALG